MTPLVTLITPAHNHASYLAETIDSVLAQTYRPLEYLVIDDGSTDETQAVLARYAGRLTALSQANQGEAAAVNRGLALAQGAIIGVVNADDPVQPTLVARAVAALESQPDALAVYPGWQRIDLHSQPMGEPVARAFDYARMLRDVVCLVGPGALFRRTLVERIGGRDPRYRYVGDFDFWLRAGLVGPILHISETLAAHRVHSGSATVGAAGERLAEEHVTLIEHFFAQASLPPELEALRADSLGMVYYRAAGWCLPDAPARAHAYYRQSFAQTGWRHPLRLARWLALSALPAPLHHGALTRARALKRGGAKRRS